MQLQVSEKKNEESMNKNIRIGAIIYRQYFLQTCSFYTWIYFFYTDMKARNTSVPPTPHTKLHIFYFYSIILLHNVFFSVHLDGELCFVIFLSFFFLFRRMTAWKKILEFFFFFSILRRKDQKIFYECK